MQGNTLNLHTTLTSGVEMKVRYTNCADVSIIFFIKLSTKSYLKGVFYDRNDTEVELRV